MLGFTETVNRGLPKMLDMPWKTEAETPRIEPVLPKFTAPPSLDYGAFGLNPEEQCPFGDGRSIGCLVADDLAALLGSDNPGSIVFKLAFLHLWNDPLWPVGGEDGGLVLAIARALAAKPDSLMPDCERTLREYTRRQLVHADAALWGRLGRRTRALGLDDAVRRTLRQSLEDADPKFTDPRFLHERAILERLTEARMRIARQGIQLTACDRRLFARPEGSNRSKMLSCATGSAALMAADRLDAVAEDTIFAIIPDGDRVRVCYFTEACGDCWHGPAYGGVEDALAAAKSVYGVPMSAWSAC